MTMPSSNEAVEQQKVPYTADESANVYLKSNLTVSATTEETQCLMILFNSTMHVVPEILLYICTRRHGKECSPVCNSKN